MTDLLLIIVISEAAILTIGWPFHQQVRLSGNHQCSDVSLAQARVVVQEHRNCLAAYCPKKREALRVRIFAGEIRPARELHELLFQRFAAEIR